MWLFTLKIVISGTVLWFLTVLVLKIIEPKQLPVLKTLKLSFRFYAALTLFAVLFFNYLNLMWPQFEY